MFSSESVTWRGTRRRDRFQHGELLLPLPRKSTEVIGRIVSRSRQFNEPLSSLCVNKTEKNGEEEEELERANRNRERESLFVN